MPKVNIEELQRLREGAEDSDIHWEVSPPRVYDKRLCQHVLTEGTEDYIVALHNQLPDILHELKTLRDAIEKVRGMDNHDCLPETDDDPVRNEGRRSWNTANWKWRNWRNAILEEVDKEYE